MDDSPLYFGRFQQGEQLPLAVRTSDETLAPADPAASPVVTIYRDAEPPVLVQTVELAAADRGAVSGMFRRPLFLGVGYEAAGRYLVVVRWQTAGGVGRCLVGSFTLLPGGDPDGAVIAVTFVARPDANHLIAQTDSGRLIRGRNPR